MIVGTYEDNQSLRNMTDSCLLYMKIEEYKKQFEIYLSDNIMEDYKQYSANKMLKTEAGGITILPTCPEGKIVVLISQKEDVPFCYVVHEICHVMDFILFANEYCEGCLNNVEEHKYYQLLVFWSEFHVKLYDNAYPSLIIDLYKGKTYDKALEEFRILIHDAYYTKINDKFLNKFRGGIQVRDVMYYLGEIAMCNWYDPNNNYVIPINIISKYGFEILELYKVLYKCLSYEDFSRNIIEVKKIFEKQEII